MDQPTVLTCYKFRSGSIVVYPNFELYNRVRVGRGMAENSRENLKDNRVKGTLSIKASRRVKRLVETWVLAIRSHMVKNRIHKTKLYRYMTFVTLTLSGRQIHDDKFIKRHLLNRFMIEAKREWKIKNWLWRAEKQKNGNIHFHILIDRPVGWRKVRDKWNAIQKDFGYLDSYREKYGNEDPNSTDIHGLYQDKKGREIKFIGGYIAKYLTKNELENDLHRVDGRCWGCSDSLKQITSFSDLGDLELTTAFNDFCSQKETDFYQSDYCGIAFGDWWNYFKHNKPVIFARVCNHYQSIFDFLYQNKPKEKDKIDDNVSVNLTICQKIPLLAVQMSIF